MAVQKSIDHHTNSSIQQARTESGGGPFPRSDFAGVQAPFGNNMAGEEVPQPGFAFNLHHAFRKELLRTRRLQSFCASRKPKLGRQWAAHGSLGASSSLPKIAGGGDDGVNGGRCGPGTITRSAFFSQSELMEESGPWEQGRIDIHPTWDYRTLKEAATIISQSTPMWRMRLGLRFLF
jgi:hypothetical protein